MFTEPEPAVFILENLAEGNVRFVLGNQSHVFPEGLSAWEGIRPGSYTAEVTILTGPCANDSFTTELNLDPGEVDGATIGCPRAKWEVDNQTGGNIRAELIGFGSHLFPQGVSRWVGIEPGTYTYRITIEGGGCNGQTLSDTVTFEPFSIFTTAYTCRAHDNQLVGESSQAVIDSTDFLNRIE